jgi:low affinity Fe/Cu permease
MAMDQSATASRPGRSDKVSEGTKRNHALSLYFSKFAHAVAHMAGTPTAFLLAMLTIVMWAITGPIFGYSDTWQLVINTGTTIVTFLMVFLIQNTQNPRRAGGAAQAFRIDHRCEGRGEPDRDD